MKMSEMIEAMSKAGSNGSSQLQMRSETLQNKIRVPRIKNLKKDIKKKSKLLVVAELAFPFDPTTGEVTDEFNQDTKYRPALSATTVALAMKDSAEQNPKLKEKLMKRAGITEWDTTNCEEFNDTDWKIFEPYRVPRIFTVVATHINIQAMNTGSFGRDFAVDVKRDPRTGEVIGPMPSFLKVNKLFNDKAYEQIKEYEDQIQSGKIKQTADQQQETKLQIRNSSPVSDDRHINYIQAFEVPLDNEYIVDTKVDFAADDAEVQTRCNKKIQTVLDSYLDGSFRRFDHYFDFWEIDMSCPVKGDTSCMSGKAALGRDTKFDKGTICLNSADDYHNGEDTQNIVDAVSAYLDKELNVEEKMRRSIGVSVFDESVENDMFRTLKTVIDLKDRYITQKVAQANAEVISLIFGEEGDAFLEEIDANVSDKDEGALDEKDSAVAAKAAKYDLESSDFNNDAADLMGDLDSIDLPELNN